MHLALLVEEKTPIPVGAVAQLCVFSARFGLVARVDFGFAPDLERLMSESALNKLKSTR